jgi:Cytochrome P450
VQPWILLPLQVDPTYGEADLGFGYDVNSLQNPNNPLAQAYTTFFHKGDMPMPSSAANFISWLSKIAFPRALEIAAARRSIMAHATQMVRNKESECVGHDILSHILAENKNSDGRLTEKEMVNQVMTFLLAGHETTASAVFILYCFLLTVGNMGITSSCSTSGHSTTVT